MSFRETSDKARMLVLALCQHITPTSHFLCTYFLIFLMQITKLPLQFQFLVLHTACCSCSSSSADKWHASTLQTAQANVSYYLFPIDDSTAGLRLLMSFGLIAHPAFSPCSSSGCQGLARLMFVTSALSQHYIATSFPATRLHAEIAQPCGLYFP